MHLQNVFQLSCQMNITSYVNTKWWCSNSTFRQRCTLGCPMWQRNGLGYRRRCTRPRSFYCRLMTIQHCPLTMDRQSLKEDIIQILIEVVGNIDYINPVVINIARGIANILNIARNSQHLFSYMKKKPQNQERISQIAILVIL